MPAAEAMPRAFLAARKALQLDHSLGEPHASLAFCLEGFDWDFAGADKEFLRAVELSPGYATAHHWYAWHLSLMGRNKEAIAEMDKAVNLDPASPGRECRSRGASSHRAPSGRIDTAKPQDCRYEPWFCVCAQSIGPGVHRKADVRRGNCGVATGDSVSRRQPNICCQSGARLCRVQSQGRGGGALEQSEEALNPWFTSRRGNSHDLHGSGRQGSSHSMARKRV
jgi:tetratricopeptide (TPR) repeat protein